MVFTRQGDDRTLYLRGATVDLATGTLGGDRPGHLTTRELALLAYLAARPGQTVSRNALLTDGFGYSDAAVSRAVDKAMSSLRDKVEVDPANPDHLITVVGTGYRFEPGSHDTPSVRTDHPLPTEVDRFVGREGPCAELRTLLTVPGLVVVLGPGGIGKTRLALTLAREAPGARFVDLSGARSREDLLSTVGASFGVPLTVPGVQPEEQLGQAIAALGPRIVVLDNLEQLTDHADLLDLWCRRAPEARLLVTSRQALGLAAERLFRLEPMSVDEGTELLLRRAAQRGYDVARDDAVADLVRSLDGLPLALELAAARLGVLGVRDLLARVDDRLRLLRSRDPLAPARHATLTATLDGSWSLLDGPEQTAMAELSVFTTDFAVDAAEAVLQRPADGREALDVVDRLLDASLLQRRSVNGTVRLGMLETVRLYAAERLAALAPESRQRAETACTTFYLHLGEALRDGLGPDGGAKIRRLSRELDHLVTACRRSVAAGDGAGALSTLETCAEMCVARGPWSLYVGLARGVAAMPSLTGRRRAEANWQLGRAMGRVDGEEARVLLERALAQASELGESLLADRVRSSLGAVLKDLGLRDAAHAVFEHCANSPDPAVRASNRKQLAVMVYTSGAYEEALRQFTDAEDDARRAGDLLLAAIARNNAVWSAIRLGRLDQARTMLEECGTVFEAFDARIGLLHNQATLGHILTLQGEGERAMELMRTAAAGFRALGDKKSLLVVVGETGGLLCRDLRFDEALVCFLEAETLAKDLGDRRSQGALVGGRAEVLVGLGRVDEALALLAEARTALRPMGTTDVALGVELVFADTLRAASRFEEARVVLAEVEGCLRDLGHPPTSQLGREVTRIRASLP